MPDRQRRLQHWNAAWRLSETTIQCCQCGNTQPSQQAYSLFPHAARCSAQSEGSQHPWLDLEKLLLSVFDQSAPAGD